jgi:hypothetical protein
VQYQKNNIQNFEFKFMIMIYPILAYKEPGESQLFGFKNDRSFRHTSRELLKQGVFNNVFIIDSIGDKYKLENVREAGWANLLWGLSIFRKGRQILIDFDLKLIDRKSIEDIRFFALDRVSNYKRNILRHELLDEIKRSETITQIINCFI